MLLFCTQVGTSSLRLRVQLFFRPEDISRELAYKSGLWDLYALAADAAADVDAGANAAPEQESDSSSSSSGPGRQVWVDVSCVMGKCAVKEAGAPQSEGKRSHG
jgi:hypothetical protein